MDDEPRLKEFQLSVYESRAKARLLAVHREFVVPTIDLNESLAEDDEQQPMAWTTTASIPNDSK